MEILRSEIIESRNNLMTRLSEAEEEEDEELANELLVQLITADTKLKAQDEVNLLEEFGLERDSNSNQQEVDSK